MRVYLLTNHDEVPVSIDNGNRDEVDLTMYNTILLNDMVDHPSWEIYNLMTFK